VERFIKGFVLPEKVHQAHDVLKEAQRNLLQRDMSFQNLFKGVQEVNDIVILICGHGGRDQRCGVIGPVLQAEFQDQLRNAGFNVGVAPSDSQNGRARARVGLISHIGGHKFAGNVIIYIPPSLTNHSLAGNGIWYGRVTPQHIEGIVKTTICGGMIIKDMFRGGITRERDILRL
jgi:hypothetical protein